MASSVSPPELVEVVNADGTLRIWVTPVGLPLHVEITPALLARGGRAVADEVVALCRRAAS